MKASELTASLTALLSLARELGMTVSCRGTTLTVSAKFPVGDKAEFAKLDMMAGSVLGYMPAKGGSVWGTDGGSMGGAIALQTGRFAMNQSGCSKQAMAALAKML